MKKLSLVIAALAMMLGITQCKKQEDPVGGKLITQEVTFTTSFGDGSKFNVTEGTGPDAGTLSLSWVEGDEITVTDDAATPNVSTLECKSVSDGGKTGTFKGTITSTEGAELTFTVGDEPKYKNQHFTSITKKEIYLKGTSVFKKNGDYGEIPMKLPYAILKVDLAELAPESGSTDVSVKIGGIGGNEVAKVINVSASYCQVYLLLPLTATGQTTLTFDNNNGKTITKSYPLAPNGFYTGGGNGGYAPVEPTFSVSETTTVKFSPGNLYWDGSKFKFEAKQWSFASTWDASYVSHFFWSKTASVAYAASYSDGSAASGDVFFTNATETTANENFQVSGETKGTWRTLSNDEWAYLLNTSGSSGRNDANRFAKALVNGVKGLLVFPDGYTLPSDYTTADGGTGMAKVNKTSSTDAPWPDASIPETTWTLMESAGVVFLPAAGSRTGTSVSNFESGYYWSSTTSAKTSAYHMQFLSGNVNTANTSRKTGRPVRLVR